MKKLNHLGNLLYWKDLLPPELKTRKLLNFMEARKAGYSTFDDSRYVIGTRGFIRKMTFTFPESHIRIVSGGLSTILHS